MATPMGRSRGRQIRQQLPKAPPEYDQNYISQLANAINQFMIEATAPAEMTAARFICTDPVYIPADMPDPTYLPTGMLYLKQVPGAPAGTYFVTIVTPQDPSP
jgi:hypothetical protein